MNRRAASPAVAAIIVVVLLGIGAAAYYLAAAPGGSTTTTSTPVPSIPSTTSSSSSTTTVAPTATMSTSTSSSASTMTSASIAASSSSTTTQSTTKTTSSQASLHVAAIFISHNLGGRALLASCGTSMPAQGASYIQVTNNGTAPAEITRIDIAYVEMMTSVGTPTNSCVVGVGSTEYITLSGVGADPATMGAPYSLSLEATNGGFTIANGSFG